MAADGRPVKVISEQIGGGFEGLHQDVATVSVLGFEVRNSLQERHNRPETF